MKELVLYGVFGVLTTAVNIGVYAVVNRLGTVASTVVAWFVSVMFAYITNRLFVFHSKGAFFRECLLFFGGRLATGAVDLGIMYVFVDTMDMEGIVIKTVANGVVIILNYVVSKIIIFKEGSVDEEVR